MRRREALRILDANFNRAREGLRVCEEISRFTLRERFLTRRLKSARHELSGVLKKLSQAELVRARAVSIDVGREFSPLERERRDAMDLFLANAQRAKEALRVLEEMLKWLGEKNASTIKKTRFELYGIEKSALPKLEALRHHDERRRAEGAAYRKSKAGRVGRSQRDSAKG